MPLPPTANAVILEFWQGSAVVQSEPPEAVDAAVEDIKEAAAGEQHGAHRVGAAGRYGQAVDGIQLAGIVIDLEAADDAVAGGWDVTVPVTYKKPTV